MAARVVVSTNWKMKTPERSLHKRGLPPVRHLSLPLYSVLRTRKADAYLPGIECREAHSCAGCPKPAPTGCWPKGKTWEWWHPLVSGDPNTVHTAGISVRWRTLAEKDVDMDNLEDYIVD